MIMKLDPVNRHRSHRPRIMLQTAAWAIHKNIFLVFVLFITTKCLLVSGHNATLAQYFLNDTRCEAWIENLDNETERCVITHRTMYCFGDLDFPRMEISITQMKRIENLYICGFSQIAFDANKLLKYFRQLKNLKVAYSNLTHINNDFPVIPSVEVINITKTDLAYTRPSLFEKLGSLKILDLRRNKLDHMEGPLLLMNRNFQAMYLSGNQWNCTRNMKWLLKFDEGQKVADKDLMRCVDLKYTGRPLLTVMDFKQTIRLECQKEPDTRNCSCILSYVRPSLNGEFLIPMYTVNCSHREFLNLPKILPMNTTILHISHNKIKSLEPLRSGNYKKVQDLFVDYNQIKTLDYLEGALWLNKFRVLSLRGNKLTKLTYHVMDNALERNPFAIQLYLSQNPWRCDCIFTPHFQDLIIKYKAIVKDANNISCKYLEGDKNFGISVITLNRGDVCVTSNTSSNSIKPIDILNIVMASLIVFIFVKLAYDYYHYKKYSKLPWFVTKLP